MQTQVPCDLFPPLGISFCYNSNPFVALVTKLRGSYVISPISAIVKAAKDPSIYTQVFRFFLQLYNFFNLQAGFDLADHVVKYLGQSLFFRHRLRNERINRQFRENRGIQNSSVVSQSDQKPKEQPNSFTPADPKSLVKPNV